MSTDRQPADELRDLLWSIEDGSIAVGGIDRIDDLVREDERLLRQYIEYTRLISDLRFGPTNIRAHHVLARLFGVGEGLEPRDKRQESDPVIRDFESPAPGSESLVPPVIILSPLPSPLSPPSSFVGGPVFSYMVSAVILGMMLLGAWAYKITHYQQIAEAPSATSNARPELVFVGRITGMVDCRWADPQTEAYAGASVPLGRKYALSSGLMEVTYTTGAKVILQGPCTYEVESRAGGYLSLGKLTAKVETKGSGVRGQGSEKTNPKSPNPKSPDPWSLTPGPLFAVRTPTAIVTDLGTEFGVEVSESGSTLSHVFRGSVRVQVVGDNLPFPFGGGAGDEGIAGGEGRVVQLGAGESARVEKGKDADDLHLVLGGKVGAPPKFVRRLVEPPKLLDLLDIVAGGNGTGNRRERGIDPTTGMEDPMYVPQRRGGYREFRPVAWHRLIDGVFAPAAGAGSVQVDSAGHVFDEFQPTCGIAWGSIWARAAEVKPNERAKKREYGIKECWIYAMGRAEQFMPEDRGLLAMHANCGITFDLKAVGRVHFGVVPARFHAVAGLADAHGCYPEASSGLADVWVLVDGKLRFKRIKLRPQDGPVLVDVELRPGERFLTLLSTDGGNEHSFDWVVFGDPVLRMASTEPQTTLPDRKEGRPMEQ